jgi:lipid-A-disaccharide synthase
MTYRVAIIAGEYSSDMLGAELIRALKKYDPDVQVYGIAGPQMEKAGCEVLYSVEELAMVGIVEPLKHLPRLLSIRHALYKKIIQDHPDIFIGIDAPDFNLGLELKLKKAGIRVVHYVSPSVWAWRKNRIHKIKRAVDLMLTLFPFETAIYQEHQIPVKFVGHPLADQIPLEIDQQAARQQLGLNKDGKVLALLPGSRRMEIHRLGGIFLKTAAWCMNKDPSIQIVAAMVNDVRAAQFSVLCKKVALHLPIQIIVGDAQRVMQASDIVLVASGTATLEAMLCKRPMVVAYRLAALTYWIAKRLVHLKYFSLPNLLTNQALVPEFLQEQVTPELLGTALMNLMNDKNKCQQLVEIFTRLHRQLKCGASAQAAAAIMRL